MSSNLIPYAEEELDRAGLGDPDADYDGALKNAVLDVIRVFSEQGHSGMSAAMTTAMVERLMRYEPITPLTGADDEWQHVADQEKRGALYQNRRCPRVFKDDRGAYDIEGRVFVEPSGSAFTSSGSRVPVRFPCTPTTKRIRLTWWRRALRVHRRRRI